MSGRIALVSGGGRGIGRATAELLARRGMTVIAVSRTETDLVSLQRSAGVDYIVGGVESETGCEEVVDEITRRHGRVDVLVNNAGVDSGEEREIWRQEPTLWRAYLAVNLDAAFHLTRLTVGGMVERRWGRVVMVSSTAGEVGGAKASAYCASKHGMLGLMRAVAQDVAAHGVTCNAVCPSWVRTSMSERTAEVEARKRSVDLDEIWRQRIHDSPAGRLVTPDEVAESISFLASTAASGINGEAVTISLGSVW
jgi:NAD(P)-dependent dehydrogenase (short-subunit alcohol dehydrogenase family)